jgi:hypothetical protein
VPTQACLLFTYGSEKVGVGAPDDLTDVLQVFMPLLPDISERIASRYTVVIQSDPLSYELGSGMSIALTRLYVVTFLFYRIYLQSTTNMLDFSP